METQKLSFEDFKNIIVERLGCEPEQVTMDASFQEDLNADSLDLVELIYAFEENTGLEIPDEDAEKITTVGQAWEYIQEKAGSYHSSLDRYRSLPAPVRGENFKGRLQQVAQERFGETPVYDSEGARVGNRREYTSVVFAGAEPLGTGHGASKQEAEQDAARAALESLVGSVKEMPAAKPARPRTRRAPRQKRETAT